MKYSLEVKQLVRFPYCRIYRSFIEQITADSSLRKHGEGLLFYYMVLFSLANYRTSFRTLDGIRFTVHAGEWVAQKAELCEKMGFKYQHQLIKVLTRLQDMKLIHFTEYPKNKLVKFKICTWAKTNTTLDYNAPCQKDIGFFFFPVDTTAELLSAGKCSEADIMLDLWLHTVFNDAEVMGSDTAPMVYFRDGSGKPLVNYADMAMRWGISKSSVYRVLKKLEQKKLIAVFAFPGKVGSVIYLRSYLSTMFCVSDLAPTIAELSVKLSIHLTEQIEELPNGVEIGTFDCVSDGAKCVSNPSIRRILENTRKALFASGLRCSACSHAIYRLSSLSDCTGGNYRYDLAIECPGEGAQYYFTLDLRPAPDADETEVS